MHYTRKRILLVSLLLEGALTAVYLLWYLVRHSDAALHSSSPHALGAASADFDLLTALRVVAVGVAAAGPLFGVNYLLFGPLSHRVRFLSSCFEFKDRIVKPLANELDRVSAGVVAVCAGIGEELFFRGLLQEEFGIVAASVAFSFLHFGPAVKKYLFIAVLYCLIGGYFGAIYQLAGTIWVPIVTHVVYDYFALLYMRYAYISPLDMRQPLPPNRR